PVGISCLVNVRTATKLPSGCWLSIIGSLYLVIRPSPSSQNLNTQPGYILLCLVSAIVSGNHTHIVLCQTHTTFFGPTARHLLHSPSQAHGSTVSEKAKSIQHPHSSAGSRFRKGGHLWIAIRPVPPAHRLQTSPT